LRVQLDGAIAFVSGRPLEDIDRIFAPLKLPAVGGHGAEIRMSETSAVKRHTRVSFDPALKAQFYEIAKIGPGIIVEDKDYSIALHYRLAPQLGGQVMDAVAAIYEHAGSNTFEILPGKSVVEIKPRGFNKGVGLKYLMRHAPFMGRRPVFIGDDTTDHAAFAVLPDFRGIGYSVGGIVPGASFNFDGPKDVRLWLEQLSRGIAVEAR
jgi:trehalose 6-phosphate phosphatase